MFSYLNKACTNRVREESKKIFGHKGEGCACLYRVFGGGLFCGRVRVLTPMIAFNSCIVTCFALSTAAATCC